ncbi:MAG: SDR family oxidoreductase [Fuerstiella sp.]
MDLQLKDKVALISGGASGIGKGIVDCLLQEGCKVAFVDRSESGVAQQSVAEAGGFPLLFIQGDLTKEQTCSDAVERTVATFGRLDILVNNAGFNDGVNLNAGPAAFQSSLQKNLFHVYSLTHFAAPHLKSVAGCILNIGSKVAITGQGGTSGYAAAKGAVNALTREWAVELAPAGVRVNTVLPAETWTPLYEKCLAALPDPDAAKFEIEQFIPLNRRLTTIEEIAHTAVFLASPRSSHTTGQMIVVDGGYTHLDRKCTSTGSATDFGGAL